jgi:DNA-binding MarR family transcriptional regulator
MGVDASLAADLSRLWRELGTILASRRLLASLSREDAGRLTPTKLRGLQLLAESGGGLRIGDLAAGMAVDETTATRLADRLEAMGAATRERAADDRRATVVVLTPEGKRLAAEAAQRHQDFVRDVLAALDPDERTELVRLTEKAAAALRARSEELAAR